MSEPLDVGEIEVGLVIWLDFNVLVADRQVRKTRQQVGGGVAVRPFLCVRRNGEQSTWAPLTGTEAWQRLPIRPEWRSGGEPGWLTEPNFLNDGANVFIGPNACFVNASRRERTTRRNRSRVNADGVRAVLAEIDRQRPRRDPTAA